jgi:hypothetical protein
MYKQSTFGADAAVEAPAPDATPAPEPQIINTDPSFIAPPAAPAPDLPVNDPAPIVTDTPAAPAADPAPPVNEDGIVDTTEFSLGLDDPASGTPSGDQPPSSSPATTPFNLDEEIKKVPRKELLAKVGVPEFAIELAEHLINGGAATDYLTARAVDYSKVSDEVLIKADMKAANPHLDDEKITKLFNRKYGISEFASEDDREITQIQMEADAGHIRNKKIAEQQKFKVPDAPVHQVEPEYEQWKQQRDSAAAAMDQHKNFVINHPSTKALNESKKIALNFGEGVRPFNIQVNNPEQITRALTDDGTIMNRLLTTNTGDLDVGKQQLLTVFLANPQKFIQDVFNYGQQVGVHRKFVGDGQNPGRPASVVQLNRADEKATYAQGKFGDKQR